MDTPDIILLLLITIIGGMTVLFLSVPGSFGTFKENIRGLWTLKNNTPDINITEIPYPDDLYGLSRCSMQEFLAGSDGGNTSALKKVSCSRTCDSSKLLYHDFKCVNDKLICLCENNTIK